MTITITHTTEADGTPVIDISQHITGGIKGSSEHRILDNKPHPHKDNIFGNVDSSNGLLNAKDGKPDFTPTVSVGDAKKDGFIASFLRGEIGADGKPCEGYLTADGNDVFMHNLARSTDSTWVAEQVSCRRRPLSLCVIGRPALTAGDAVDLGLRDGGGRATVRAPHGGGQGQELSCCAAGLCAGVDKSIEVG